MRAEGSGQRAAKLCMTLDPRATAGILEQDRCLREIEQTSLILLPSFSSKETAAQKSEIPWLVSSRGQFIRSFCGDHMPPPLSPDPGKSQHRLFSLLLLPGYSYLSVS